MKKNMRKTSKNQIRKRWFAGTFSLMLVGFMLLSMAQPAFVNANAKTEADRYADSFVERTSAIELQGDAAADVLAVAKAQLGYEESTIDFVTHSVTDENGDETTVQKGMTIYGVHAGDRYGDWNGAFAQYVLDNAQIEMIPGFSTADELAVAVRDEEEDENLSALWLDGDTVPAEGDLVLFKDAEAIADAEEALADAEADLAEAEEEFAADAEQAVAEAEEALEEAKKAAGRVGIVSEVAEEDEVDEYGEVVDPAHIVVIEGDVEGGYGVDVVKENTYELFAEETELLGYIDMQSVESAYVPEEEEAVEEEAEVVEEEVEEEIAEEETVSASSEEAEEVVDEEVVDESEAVEATSEEEVATESEAVEEETKATSEPAAEPTATPEATAAPADETRAEAGETVKEAATALNDLFANAKAAMEAADLTGMRLIIGTSDASILANEKAVVAVHDGVYLLQFESIEATKEAYLNYYNQVDFIAADVAVSVAEGETDEDPAEEIITTDNVYTEEANPFTELTTALEENVAAPARTVRRIALIDTGAARSDNVIDAVSMIGEDGSDDNGHGERMVKFITEQDPDAEIISIKALGKDGKGDISAVIAGMTYAMENGASIINLSLAAYASAENAALADAVRKATEAGITVVGAAGNQGFNAKYYIPGSIAEALIVGSADETGVKIAASNFGETVDYNVVSETTSEAAARMSGFLSLNGEEGIAEVLNQGLIFATDFEGVDISGNPFDGVVAQDDAITSWAKLAKAIADVPAGGTATIKIEGDLVAATTTDTPNGTITIDGNRKIKLVADSEMIIYRNSEGNDTDFPMFNVEGDAALTVGNNVTLTGMQATHGVSEQQQTVSDGTDLEIKDGNGNRLMIQSYGMSQPNFTQNGVSGSDKWVTVDAGNGRFYIKNAATSQYLYGWNKGTTTSPKYQMYLHNSPQSGNYISTFKRNSSGKIVLFDGTNEYTLGSDQQSLWAAAGSQGSSYGQVTVTILSDTVTPATTQALYWKNGGDGTTNKTFTGDNGRGFFITVNGGTLNIEGNAKMEHFNTVDDDATAPTDVAPVYVNGGTFEMSGSSKICDNRVSYIADDNHSDRAAQGGSLSGSIEKDYLRNQLLRKNTAGGAIIANGAQATLSGNATIEQNRGDAGGVIVTGRGTKLTLNGSSGIDKNVGIHYAGAVLVQDGALVHMNSANAHMNYNVTWSKGGAVWATEWGTYAIPDTNYKTRKLGNPDAKNENGGGHFVMDDGVLEGNYAFLRGGAINVESNGVSLKGGEIRNNRCRVLGGAIYVEGDFPDYSYSLHIKQGYIGENTAIRNDKDSILDKTLVKNGADPAGQEGRPINDASKQSTIATGDYLAFPGIYQGNGGGIWLCPIGGTSVFGIDKNNTVYIDRNTAVGWPGRGRRGNDFFLERGTGSAIVNAGGLGGVWYEDPDGTTNRVPDESKVYSGVFGMVNNDSTTPQKGNITGVRIYGNRSRDGGGIAANGTVIIGQAQDIYRYSADIEITKKWPMAVLPTSASFKVYYKKANYDENKTFEWNQSNGRVGVLTSGSANDTTIDSNENGSANSDMTIDMNGTSDLTDGSDYITDGETTPDGNKRTWTYKMSLPATVTENGSTYPLYTFEAMESGTYVCDSRNNTVTITKGEVLDPTNPDHVKKLTALAMANKQVKIHQGSWKIVVVEDSANTAYSPNSETVVFDAGMVNEVVTLGHQANPTTVVDGGGNPLPDGNFSVHFTTTTMQQTFSNDLKPTVEKYVNYKVHEDIVYSDEIRYDIMAYVPLDATSVEISDELVQVLKVVDNGAISRMEAWILGGNAAENESSYFNNNHEANGSGTVSSFSSDKDYKIELKDHMITYSSSDANGRDKLTFKVDNKTGGGQMWLFNSNKIQGRWVRFTFYAKLKDEYNTSSKLETYLRNQNEYDSQDTGVWRTITDRDSYDGNYGTNKAAKDANAAVIGGVNKGDARHFGIANNAHYKVTNKANVTTEQTSNTVTVKPPQVMDIKLKKVSAGTDEGLANAKFNLFRINEDGTKEWATAIDSSTNAITWGGQTEPATPLLVTPKGGLLRVAMLTAGTYGLKEVTPPAGYDKIIDEFVFSITGQTVVQNGVANVSLGDDYALQLGGKNVYFVPDDPNNTTQTEGYLTTDSSVKNAIQVKVRGSGGGTAVFEDNNGKINPTQEYTLRVNNLYLQGRAYTNGDFVHTNVRAHNENNASYSRWKFETTDDGSIMLHSKGGSGGMKKSYMYLSADRAVLVEDENKAQAMLTTQALEIETDAEDTFVINIPNDTKKYPVTVKKVEQGTTTALGGAKFKIVKKGTTEVVGGGEKTTNTSDGKATFENLDWDVEYTLIEVEPPAGYNRIIRDAGVDFKIDKAGKVSMINGPNNGSYTYAAAATDNNIEIITVQNARKNYEIQLKKVDSVNTATTVPGAKFKLYKKNGSNKQYATMNANGNVTGWDATGDVRTTTNTTITFSGLDWGTEYFLEETEAPTGYKKLLAEDVKFMISKAGEVSLVDSYDNASVSTANNINLITVKNQKLFKVELEKQDAKGTKLADAKFKLYKKVSGSPGVPMTKDGKEGSATELTTTTSSNLLWENLEPGTYYLEETAPPNGYVNNSLTIPFTISNTTSGASAALTGKPADLTVDKDGNILIGGQKIYADKLAADAVFTTNATNGHALKLVKSGTKSVVTNPVVGEGYNIYFGDAADGRKLLVSNHANGGEVQDSYIQMHAYPESDGTQGQYQFVVGEKDGLMVLKLNAPTSENTDGGKINNTWAYVGYAYLDGTTLKAVKESKKNGISFYNGSLITAPTQDGNTFKFIAKNEKEKYNIKVNKVNGDNNNAPLPGATFEIYNEEPTADNLKNSSWVSTHKKGTQSGANMTFNDLETGTYYIREAKAPDGYQLINAPVKVELGESGAISLRNAATFSVDGEGRLQLDGQKLYITSAGAVTTAQAGNTALYLRSGTRGNENEKVTNLTTEQDYYIRIGTSDAYLKGSNTGDTLRKLETNLGENETYNWDRFKWRYVQLSRGNMILENQWDGAKKSIYLDESQVKLADRTTLGDMIPASLSDNGDNGLEINVVNKSVGSPVYLRKTDMDGKVVPYTQANGSDAAKFYLIKDDTAFSEQTGGNTGGGTAGGNTGGGSATGSGERYPIYSSDHPINGTEYYIHVTKKDIELNWERGLYQIKDASGNIVPPTFDGNQNLTSPLPIKLGWDMSGYINELGGPDWTLEGYYNKTTSPSTDPGTGSGQTPSITDEQAAVLVYPPSGKHGDYESITTAENAAGGIYGFRKVGADANDTVAGNVDPGMYWLVEKKGPDGYKPSAPIKVVISRDTTGKSVVRVVGTSNYFTAGGPNDTFSFSLKNEPNKVNFEAWKTVQNQHGAYRDIQAGAYTFILERKSGKDANNNAIELAKVPMPANAPENGNTATATNQASGLNKKAKVVFGDIVFTQPGTYIYTISEQDMSGKNMSYDKHTYDVKVVVTRNAANELVVDIKYDTPGTTTLVPELSATQIQRADEYKVTKKYTSGSHTWGISNATATGYSPTTLFCLNLEKTQPDNLYYKRVTEEDFGSFITQVGVGAESVGDNMTADQLEKKIITILYYGMGDGNTSFNQELTSAERSHISSYYSYDRVTQMAIWKATEGQTTTFQNRFNGETELFRSVVNKLYNKRYETLPSAVRALNLRLDLYRVKDGTSGYQSLIGLNCVTSVTYVPMTTPPTFRNVSTETYEIKLLKKNAKTSADLKGAIFSLYTETDYNGAKEHPRTIDGTDSDRFEWNNVPAGTYYIVEDRAPEGYAKLTQAIKVTVTPNRYDTSTATLTLDNSTNNGDLVSCDKDTLTLTARNNKLPFEVNLVKTDDTGKKLGAATFNIKKLTAASAPDTYTAPANALKDDLQISGNGTTLNAVVLPELDTGMYMLTETAAPSGYIVSSTPWFIEMKYVENSGAWTADAKVYRSEIITGQSASKKIKVGETIYALTEVDKMKINNNNNKDYNRIDNEPVYELPSSGGIGTYWNTIIGTMFLCMAGAFMLRAWANKAPVRADRNKKRMNMR